MTIGLVGRKCGMTRVFTDDGLSPQDSNWSTPVIIAERNDGDDGDPGATGDDSIIIDLTNEKSIYTNTISFDWTKDESQYEMGGAYYVSDSLEIDQKTSMDIGNRNMEIYYSNKNCEWIAYEIYSNNDESLKISNCMNQNSNLVL